MVSTKFVPGKPPKEGEFWHLWQRIKEGKSPRKSSHRRPHIVACSSKKKIQGRGVSRKKSKLSQKRGQLGGWGEQ